MYTPCPSVFFSLSTLLVPFPTFPLLTVLQYYLHPIPIVFPFYPFGIFTFLLSRLLFLSGLINSFSFLASSSPLGLSTFRGPNFLSLPIPWVFQTSCPNSYFLPVPWFFFFLPPSSFNLSVLFGSFSLGSFLTTPMDFLIFFLIFPFNPLVLFYFLSSWFLIPSCSALTYIVYT